MKQKTILILGFILINSLVNINFASCEDTGYSPKPASASLYNLGLKSYESGNFDGAITYFKQAVDLDPSFLDAHFNLGAIYKKKNDNANAISSFQKVVELDPGDHEATYELASCYFAEKNYLKAKEYYTRIPNTFSRYTEVKANLDKANNFLTTAQPPQVSNVNAASPEAQAQLLANKLTNQPEIMVQIQQGLPSNPSNVIQEQLLINELTKSDSGSANLKIISKGFAGPTGIVKDTNGNIYIANFKNNNIEKISINGNKELFYQGTGIKGPVGLAIDENNNIYAANYTDGTVVRITQNKQITILITNLEKPYYLFYDRNNKTLLITSQGDNSLVEISTSSTSQPLSYK